MISAEEAWENGQQAKRVPGLEAEIANLGGQLATAQAQVEQLKAALHWIEGYRTWGQNIGNFEDALQEIRLVALAAIAGEAGPAPEGGQGE